MRFIAVLALLVPGCSYWRVPNAESPATCTTSRAAPRIDRAVAILGAVEAVASGLVLVTPAREGNFGDTASKNAAPYLLVGGLVVLAGYGLSEHHGYVETDRCRALNAASSR